MFSIQLLKNYTKDLSNKTWAYVCLNSLQIISLMKHRIINIYLNPTELESTIDR